MTLGEKTLGILTQPIKVFSEGVSNMKKAYTYIFEAPDYYIKTKDQDTLNINKLNYNLYGLYSYRHGDVFNIELKNFKDNSLKHQWTVPVKKLLSNQELNHIMSNSFGFGGNCSSLIFSKN